MLHGNMSILDHANLFTAIIALFVCISMSETLGNKWSRAMTRSPSPRRFGVAGGRAQMWSEVIRLVSRWLS